MTPVPGFSDGGKPPRFRVLGSLGSAHPAPGREWCWCVAVDARPTANASDLLLPAACRLLPAAGSVTVGLRA